MMSTIAKKSRYIEAGSPGQCFLPSCKNPFDSTCFRGKDERFYCTDACANDGFDVDLTTVEPLRKRG
jgi:hypothetical protein